MSLMKACAGALALGVAMVVPAGLATAQDEARFAAYQEFNPDSQMKINYDSFSIILDGIVYDVGPSDRFRPSRPLVRTGTRINRSGNSRYASEGNRIWYHRIEDSHQALISEYRQELEQIPAIVDLASLNRNEQLAYWLNLHNMVILDELAQRYPLGSINSQRAMGMRLEDAPIVNLPDGAISLNDIRHRIVADGWGDPRVMYGFYTGAIGGPSIQTRAFTGDRVWSQLQYIGREFVNSLRGVERSENPVRVSALYFEYQETLFPNWPEDLRRHLLRYADDDVDAIVRGADRFRQASFENSIADLTNGTMCGSGQTRYIQVQSTEPGEGTERACNPIPPEAEQLIIDVQTRRLRLFRDGELGRVIVRDLDDEEAAEALEDADAAADPESE